MHQNMTFITFKKIWTKILELGFNYSIEKPTKYIQDLIIDTENAVTHLDTKILITSAYWKIPQIIKSKDYKHFTQKTITYNKINS